MYAQDQRIFAHWTSQFHILLCIKRRTIVGAWTQLTLILESLLCRDAPTILSQCFIFTTHIRWSQVGRRRWVAISLLSLNSIFLSIVALLGKGLLCVISVLHYLILAHLVTHVWIALHVVVHLISPLAYHVHGCCSSRTYWVCVWSSCYYRDCSIGSIIWLALFENLPYLVLVDRLALIVELQFILGATHSENFKAVDFWDELCWTFW